MTPTPKLRWVERDAGFGVPSIEVDSDKFIIPPKARVLQQWWIPENFEPNHKAEWRDVPLEEET